MLGMIGRALILLATMAVALVLPAAAGASADPNYPPTVQTQLHVSVKPHFKEHQKVPISLRVSVNANITPTGDIKVRVSKVASGSPGEGLPRALAAPVWSTTVHYDGHPMKVTAPGFVEGNYVVDGTFFPDDPQLQRSSDSDRFDVRDGGTVEGDDSDRDDASGALPDTGGPNWWWLAAGLALIGGGAGVVLLARRRQAAAPTAQGEVAASV